jgi:predicted RND superfamily exporter protein
MQQNRVAELYTKFVMKYKWAILGVVFVATILALTQFNKIDIRNDPDTLLPQTNKYVATNNFIEDNFGMGNIFVVGVEVKEGSIYQDWFVNTVQEIHNKLEGMEHANKSNFISIAAQKVKNMGVTEDGSLLFKRLIPITGIDTKDTELGQEQLDFMKEGIDTNPVLKPFIVYEESPTTGKVCEKDEEGCTAKATFIIADYNNDIKTAYVSWVKEVVEKLEPYQNDDRIRISIAGEPYFLAWMMVNLIDHWYLFVLSILIAFGILFWETRTIKGAVFPLMGVAISIIWTLGLMGFSEFKLTTMMVLTPMLILAIGIGHAIQVTRRYTLSVKQGEDFRVATSSALLFTIVPATLSIVTDAVGFATLSTVDISFYKAYAYFGMFGMFSLILTTTTLIPILLNIFPDRKSGEGESAEFGKWELQMGEQTAGVLIDNRKRYIPIAVVGAVILASIYFTEINRGISNLFTAEETPTLSEVLETNKFDIMPGVEKGINYAEAAFKPYSQAIQDIYRLSEIMPGVITFNIPLRGKEPLKPVCDDAYFDKLYELEDAGEDVDEYIANKTCYDPEEDAPQGAFNNAEVLTALEKMEDDLREHPYIGFTASYAQYIKIANMLLMAESKEATTLDDFRIPSYEYLYEKDPDDDRNPDAIVSSYNGLLDMASSPGDLSSMIEQNYHNGVLMGFVNTMDPVKTHEVLVYIQDYIEEHKDDDGLNQLNFGFRNEGISGDSNHMAQEGENYIKPGIGGFLGATEATRDVTFENWIMNPLGTALAIFLIVTIIFRSFVISGTLILILGITLFAQYGLAGFLTSVGNWAGNLHFGNLVTLSIAMGLGVDYSIYMISRLRDEYSTTRDWYESLKITIATTGSSILISVIVLIGSFIPLMATELGNTWGLSIYITEAIIIDVFTALTILPLILFWLKPKYIFASGRRR